MSGLSSSCGYKDIRAEQAGLPRDPDVLNGEIPKPNRVLPLVVALMVNFATIHISHSSVFVLRFILLWQIVLMISESTTCLTAFNSTVNCLSYFNPFYRNLCQFWQKAVSYWSLQRRRYLRSRSGRRAQRFWSKLLSYIERAVCGINRIAHRIWLNLRSVILNGLTAVYDSVLLIEPIIRPVFDSTLKCLCSPALFLWNVLALALTNVERHAASIETWWLNSAGYKRYTEVCLALGRFCLVLSNLCGRLVDALVRLWRYCSWHSGISSGPFRVSVSQYWAKDITDNANNALADYKCGQIRMRPNQPFYFILDNNSYWSVNCSLKILQPIEAGGVKDEMKNMPHEVTVRLDPYSRVIVRGHHLGLDLLLRASASLAVSSVMHLTAKFVYLSSKIPGESDNNDATVSVDALDAALDATNAAVSVILLFCSYLH